MNIVFIGSSAFGLRCLEACLSLSTVRVTGVVTAPETFSISYRPDGVTNVLHAEVGEVAKSHTVPVRRLESTMNEPGLFEAVAGWKPDCFLVAGWYHMIPKRWRELAPAYGLHASLLPNYSGGAPLVWAMINGESKTGITLFQMDDGVDSGPIAGQKEEPIFPNDTIATLYARIEERGLELIREVLPRLADGDLALRAQNEAERRTVPQRSPEDGLIDWTWSAEILERFIRAQTRPYPGAFTIWKGKPLHIWQAQPVLSTKGENDSEPGRLHHTEQGVYSVACGTGAIILNEISYEERTYDQSHLRELFGLDEQKLGLSPSCLRGSDSC